MGDIWVNLYGGYDAWVDGDLPTGANPLEKCTCGTTITLGKDDHIDAHSPWCDLKKEKKDETQK